MGTRMPPSAATCEPVVFASNLEAHFQWDEHGRREAVPNVVGRELERQ